MKTNFRRVASVGCVSLSFFSAAACSVETDGEDPGEVASVQEALCSDTQRIICAVVCRVNSNPPPNCVEQCLSRCNQPEPPPSWPWTVSCESEVDFFGATRTDYVSVRGSLEPGTDPLPSTVLNELRNAAVAPCDALVRQTYRSQCSTLDRASTIYAFVGRTTSGVGRGGVGPLFYTYTWSNAQPIAPIAVVDLCPVETPPPRDTCGPHPCP